MWGMHGDYSKEILMNFRAPLIMYLNRLNEAICTPPLHRKWYVVPIFKKYVI